MVRRLASGSVALVTVLGVCTIRGAAEDPGRRLYEQKCGQCHGAEARGGKGPRLVPFQWSYERALDLIRHPECDMPPMSASDVSDAEVAQIVAYLKTLK